MRPPIACLFLSLVLGLAFLTAAQSISQQAPTIVQAGDEDLASKLAKVKRIYIESFGDDLPSKQAQAMIIDSLTNSHRFIVTEKKESADAVLKGVGLEKTTQEFHSSSETTTVAGAAGGHQASISGNNGNVSGSGSGGFVARGAGIADSEASTETINDARMAVRLVSSDGDVLWSTTQESKGAKYKGASADVADKVVKQLLWDLAKSESKSKPKN